MTIAETVAYLVRRAFRVSPLYPEAVITGIGAVYPNGSVPYGGDDDVNMRKQRFDCASANHHPRSYDGSWCWGYGYVCGRCFMYADPWSSREMDDKVKAAGRNPDHMDLARIAGGGPTAHLTGK